MPERAAFEIRFPVVEGYVVDLKRNLVRCDVERGGARSGSTRGACRPPPSCARRWATRIGSPGTQTGFGFEVVTREAYYRNTHLQTIAFEIAREVVRATGRIAPDSAPNGCATPDAPRLFPQVLRIVQAYIERRVDFNG